MIIRKIFILNIYSLEIGASLGEQSELGDFVSLYESDQSWYYFGFISVDYQTRL